MGVSRARAAKQRRTYGHESRRAPHFSFVCCANRRIASMRQCTSWLRKAHAASDEIIVDTAAAKIQLPFVEFTFVKRTGRLTIDAAPVAGHWPAWTTSAAAGGNMSPRRLRHAGGRRSRTGRSHQKTAYNRLAVSLLRMYRRFYRVCRNGRF